MIYLGRELKIVDMLCIIMSMDLLWMVMVAKSWVLCGKSEQSWIISGYCDISKCEGFVEFPKSMLWKTVHLQCHSSTIQWICLGFKANPLYIRKFWLLWLNSMKRMKVPELWLGLTLTPCLVACAMADQVITHSSIDELTGVSTNVSMIGAHDTWHTIQSRGWKFPSFHPSTHIVSCWCCVASMNVIPLLGCLYNISNSIVHQLMH